MKNCSTPSEDLSISPLTISVFRFWQSQHFASDYLSISPLTISAFRFCDLSIPSFAFDDFSIPPLTISTFHL
ncbi:hypothetical protein PoB_001207600 [Plakobranchus ocellatus]|uniref:Uncharacterized protein n=1 Tax=Plakobranchus ocellatus TaxID=259542 RepID=A0AAV3YT36_9GAST|nr:hypothetical protein PoB_001207600 [Plakobranchus ocellatus]